MGSWGDNWSGSGHIVTATTSENSVASNVSLHIYYLPLMGGKLRQRNTCVLVAKLELAVRGHSLQEGSFPRERGWLQEDGVMPIFVHAMCKYTHL